SLALPSAAPASVEETQVPWVQAPTLQAVPSGFTGFEQAPVGGSHVPARWHSSSAEQLIAEVGDPQMPPWHVSPIVQALASSHAAPFALGGLVHVPLTRSQVPATWH